MDINTFRQTEYDVDKKKKSSVPLSEFIKKDIIFSKSLSIKKKERFFSQAGLLFSSGVDLHTTFELSIKSLKKNDILLDIYQKILAGINEGKTLADAMKETKQFNNFDCYSIVIGEATGELSTIFNKLQTYYNKKTVQNRKITSALSYPAIVFLTTIGAMMFMLKFVVPMFAETLTRFGGELPGITVLIINLSKNITTILAVSAFVLTSVIVWYKTTSNKDTIRLKLSNFVLKLPYIGTLVKKVQLLKFTHSMDLLLSAHVPIVDCIHITQNMIVFPPLTAALNNIKKDVNSGLSFHKGLENQYFFDSTFTTMVRIGEEVNQLDTVFSHLSKQYENELDYESNILISILEPVTILVLAVAIGVILISMYLPMFKIGSVIH